VPIRLNPELVEARAASAEALARLRRSVQRHRELTGSTRAAALLASWDLHSPAMVHVRPRPDLATIVAGQEGTRAAATRSPETPARSLRAVRTS
jgi:glutamate synthase (NADPH/NADH) large chain